ncbi:LCP family glycopolymer transferase CpsA [Streptococcus porcinus]
MTESSRRQKRIKPKGNGTFTIINVALFILYTLLSLTVAFMMYTYNFLAFRHLNIIIGVALSALFFLTLFLIISKKAKWLTMLGMIIANIALALVLFTFKSTIDLTAQLNKTASFSEVEMSIVVPKNSSISSVETLKTVEAPLKMDQSNIKKLLSHLKSDKNVDLATKEVNSYQNAYEDIQSGNTEAMVMNSAYVALLEQNDANFADKVKTIYSYKIKKAIPNSQKPVNKSGIYNLYISGIDTYGPISTVSRSDVNIIMTVNMNTHKVLLTTTPRDSYVKIPDGGGNQFDKLTHAGIYGVETSMKTLENLYDIKIDNYARINFTTFAELIDLLGGIEVQNDTAFSAGGIDFPKGRISLNSKQALVFVRERHALEGGDNDRGKNQERVVTAIINKLSSIKSPNQASSIITGIQNSVQTNLSLNQMMTIANSQLEDNAQFSVESQDVTGIGSTGELPSYAMPGSALYMYKLDDASLNQAKDAIRATMEGNQ